MKRKKLNECENIRREKLHKRDSKPQHRNETKGLNFKLQESY